MQVITMALAEDHAVVRQGFVALLSEEPTIKIIGEASNGRELIDLMKVKTPDVVLLDIEMPVMNGKQALEIIGKRFPTVKAIILSMHLEPGLICEFMAMGASAFLSKETDIEELLQAIGSVVRNGHYYNKYVTDAMRQNLMNGNGVQNPFHEQALTPKEIAILKLICDSKTNEDISKILNISYSTVDFHRRNLYSKTRSQSIQDLVKYAIKARIISVS